MNIPSAAGRSSSRRPARPNQRDLLPLALAEAIVVAERIRRTVEQLDLPQAPGLRCSISLGLAEAVDADTSLREWIESADRALYRAKQAGRNRTASENETDLGNVSLG